MHVDANDIRGGARLETCGCGPCTRTKAFLDFRDVAEPPPRPAAINTWIEAAKFLRWVAFKLVTVVDAAEGASG